MLTINIPESELWDEKKQEFVTTKSCKIELEHSLVSISKWESKWKKPFLSKERHSDEESIDYIKCMTLTKDVDDNVYNNIPNNLMDEIYEYIKSPSTATVISSKNGTKNSGELVTNEIIYYWMISLNIPFECETWHLNHLLTLIQVCSIKSKPGKKMSNREILSQNAALNAARRKKLNTKG